MFLSVIVPAYNESENIELTVQELVDTIQKIPEITQHEVIVVDDHSDDHTFETVKKIGSPNVLSIRLSRRSGSHTALRAGFDHSRGDGVLYMSADGQDDPAVLPEMIKKFQKGNSIVWALRKRRNEGLIYTVCARLFYRTLHWFTRSRIPLRNLSDTDFFLLGRNVVEAVNQCKERNTSVFGLLTWMGFTQDYVETTRRPRRRGKSKWNFSSRLNIAKDWLIAFSGVPLTMMSWLGFLIAIAGFIYAIVILAFALLGKTTPGWAEPVILILIIGGIQMSMMGILGEYLWRNLDETRKRPLYFVEKKSGDSEAGENA